MLCFEFFLLYQPEGKISDFLWNEGGFLRICCRLFRYFGFCWGAGCGVRGTRCGVRDAGYGMRGAGCGEQKTVSSSRIIHCT